MRAGGTMDVLEGTTRTRTTAPLAPAPKAPADDVLARLEQALLAMPAYAPPRAAALRDRTPAPSRTQLMGVPLDVVTERQAIDRILAALEWGRGGWVVTPNLDILRQCHRDAGLKTLVRGADLVLADGQPLVWASRIAKRPLPARVAGSDLVLPLCRRAAIAGRSVFLLGGNEGTADAAATCLREEAPGLRIAGTLCPPHGFERDAAETARIREALLTAKPDIVLVALGAPKQERLIAELKPLLPQTWFLGVGITLSFICGEVRRAPEALRGAGLEWVHRLVQEPRRLGGRYLRHGLPFASRLGLWALRERFRRRSLVGV